MGKDKTLSSMKQKTFLGSNTLLIDERISLNDDYQSQTQSIPKTEKHSTGKKIDFEQFGGAL